MDTITIESLKENLTFTGDLFLDSNFILLPQTAPVTNELVEALKEWEFASVVCDGSFSLGGDIGVQTAITNPDENEVAQTSGANNIKIGESVRKAIASSKDVLLDNSDATRLQMVQKVYDEYMNYIEQVFTHYSTHKQINQEELAETVKELCVFTKENRRYILRVNPSDDTTNKNFLVRHSMRTTVLAIAIALQLRIPLSKMIDLGVTCIIHEIGMLRLPPQIYMSTKKLTPGEKAQIAKHPILGYSIAKDLNFPPTIQLGILEHHEKENGSGYPRRMTSEKISMNAKIISVACSYEAITSPRSYKDEHSQFEAIVELLKNQDNPYDGRVITALLMTVSLYPIGSYVYLSDRKIGQVIDTNPESPKYPLVQYLTEREADGSFKTVQTSAEGIKIARILTKKEQEDILSIVREKYASIKEAQEIATHDGTAEVITEEKVQVQPEVVPQDTPSQSPVAEPVPPVQVSQPETPAQENSTPKTDSDGMEYVDITMFN